MRRATQKPSKGKQGLAHSHGRPPRLRLAFLKERRLLAKEEILGDQCSAWGHKWTDEGERPSNLSKADDRYREIPKDRSSRVFTRWFACRFYSMVFDLAWGR